MTAAAAIWFNWTAQSVLTSSPAAAAAHTFTRGLLTRHWQDHQTGKNVQKTLGSIKETGMTNPCQESAVSCHVWHRSIRRRGTEVFGTLRIGKSRSPVPVVGPSDTQLTRLHLLHLRPSVAVPKTWWPAASCPLPIISLPSLDTEHSSQQLLSFNFQQNKLLHPDNCGPRGCQCSLVAMFCSWCSNCGVSSFESVDAIFKTYQPYYNLMTIVGRSWVSGGRSELSALSSAPFSTV